jgi:hypothetical protein
MNDTLAQQQAQHKTNFSSSIASSRLGFPIKNDMMTRVELVWVSIWKKMGVAGICEPQLVVAPNRSGSEKAGATTIAQFKSPCPLQ